MGYNAGFFAVFRMIVKWDLPMTTGKIRFGELPSLNQSRMSLT